MMSAERVDLTMYNPKDDLIILQEYDLIITRDGGVCGITNNHWRKVKDNGTINIKHGDKIIKCNVALEIAKRWIPKLSDDKLHLVRKDESKPHSVDNLAWAISSKYLNGKKIGMATILEEYKKDGRHWVLTQCECGNTKDWRLDHLRRSPLGSCGCIKSNVGRRKSNTNKRYKLKPQDVVDLELLEKFNSLDDTQVTVCKDWDPDIKGYASFANHAYRNGYGDGKVLRRSNKSKGLILSNTVWIDHYKGYDPKNYR